MKLSTSSNIVFDRPEGPFFHMDRMMRYAKEAGFDTLDISFYDWALPGSPFLTDEWKKWIDQVAEEKERLGMRFGQSHAYTYNFLSPALTPEERKHHEELTLRSIECCYILGSRLCVTHPLTLRSIECCYILGSRLCVTHPDTVYDSPRPMAVSEEKNAEYFRELLDKTARFDMAFAVENMCDITIAPKRKFGAYPEELVNLAKRVGDSRFGICWDARFDMAFAVENMCDITIAPKRKFGAYPEELVNLAKRVGDSRFGICWDFEHGDIMQQNQRDALRLIGSYLYATHVSDTHSATDPDLMHVLPLMGTVDWKEAVQTLREIGYEGYFSFEVNNYGRYFPECLLPEALRLMYHVGEYLLSQTV